MRVTFTLNGQEVEVEARPDEMLLGVLRRELDLTSVRQTCGVGVCGACTALLDGEPISTCILLAPLAEGREITTVEGLGGNDPVQEAFVEAQAFQCGYCTPGMILTAKRLLEEYPDPSDEKIRTYMGGNLCRCGCYAKIGEAVHLAADRTSSGVASGEGDYHKRSRGGK
ncbi:MAG: (2Fe-2S)-binding protein [Actinomycetota bacterium]|nr:(2Fe-2S)-binding protein [Actinomycetota bacterium]